MNFLAHLHLAKQCDSHLAGNLLADFIRGDPYRLYSSNVANGIKLHRFVDSYIDALPEVLRCRQRFTPETRRVSGIALDITWDHFLAKHWHRYHSTPLAHFVQQAQQEIALFDEEQPEAFTLTMERMWHQQWLLQYQHSDTIDRALERMALRRPRLYQLANCPAVIQRHYHLFEQQFHRIYPQVQQAAKTYSQQQTAPSPN
ncbi:ACP phosphodiesterase [Photobacterium nomapromontoriensis]|uniref:acyl carrier protein phosphodiesterase n=1 Tax=Photobacterium nomapromontoriensis TaxID=2910237 RepID=UPI003D0A6436